MQFTRESRSVCPVVQRGPNYIFHVLAVAGVGFTGGYAERYSDTVTREDIGILRHSAELLNFGAGQDGALTFLTVFFPAYLNLDSQGKLMDYFSCLNDGLHKGNCFRFFNRYREGFEKQRKWLYSVDHNWILQNHRLHADRIAQLGEIYHRNYPSFEYRVWPIESYNLRGASERLKRQLADESLISHWEHITGAAFRFDRFEVVLCAANEQGPDANSLGYDRVLFFYRRPPEHLFELVSHEVGTHVLIDIFRDMLAEDMPGKKHLYWAYENLARHYNAQLLDREPVYDIPGDDVYTELYRHLHQRQPDATPEQLLRAALEAKLDHDG